MKKKREKRAKEHYVNNKEFSQAVVEVKAKMSLQSLIILVSVFLK
jgi:hypothetical protein